MTRKVEVLGGSEDSWRWRLERGDLVIASGRPARVRRVLGERASGCHPVSIAYLDGGEGTVFADELRLACPEHLEAVDEDGVCPSCYLDALR